MSILESLFSGIKVFVREFSGVAADFVRVVLAEVDRSTIGRAVTTLAQGVTKRYFSAAQDLAAEEHELADKRRRDGGATERDRERLREIEAERQRLRLGLDASRAHRATEELRTGQDEVISVRMTDDEVSASVGILSSKVCPECGGTMRIRQGGWQSTAQSRRFFWQCTASNNPSCPTVKLDPKADGASVIRRPDADLDGSHTTRQALWDNPALLAKTHGRLRAGLGDADDEVVCPQHLLPLKLMPMQRGGGRLLDTYEFVCLGINPDGRACVHKVPVTTFPQVSAALRRREGHGIIDG